MIRTLAAFINWIGWLDKKRLSYRAITIRTVRSDFVFRTSVGLDHSSRSTALCQALNIKTPSRSDPINSLAEVTARCKNRTDLYDCTVNHEEAVMSQATIAPPDIKTSLADLRQRLGRIPLERIWFHPAARHGHGEGRHSRRGARKTISASWLTTALRPARPQPVATAGLIAVPYPKQPPDWTDAMGTRSLRDHTGIGLAGSGQVTSAMISNRSSMELRGTRAAVLGSTSGIGRSVALALANAGADVIVHGHSAHSRAEAVADEVRAKGVHAGVVMADLADRSAGDRLVGDAWDLWGGLDAWLHIAGADTLTGTAARLPFDAKLDLLWSVDVTATIRLCRAVGKRMVGQGSGAIVTMGWDQAETGMEGDSGELFAATKGAIMSFTRSLALSLAPTVRVNALAPGWIKTAWGEGASQPWHDRVLKETPLARWGTPEDVAQVACFLVSPAASFLTGQVIRVNGGSVR